MKDKDKKRITDSIQLLSAAFNKGDAGNVRTVIELLSPLSALPSKIQPVRGDRVQKQDAPFISTGVEWLDEWLSGGVRRSELVMFGMEPFGGKTHFQSWLAANMLRVYPKALAVHFIGEDIITDVRNMYRAVLGAKEMSRVWFVEMMDYRFGVQQIEQGTRAVEKEAKQKADIIVADHIDVMTPDYYAHSDEGGKTQIVKDLRTLAKRLDTVNITATQLHEKSKERKGRQRLFGAKVGKIGNADVAIFGEKSFGQAIKLTLDKARGREMPEEMEKEFSVDWKRMVVEEI